LTGSRELGQKVLFSWGSMLKPAAYLGNLCFGPSVGQNVRFTRPDHWGPNGRSRAGSGAPPRPKPNGSRRFWAAASNLTWSGDAHLDPVQDDAEQQTRRKRKPRRLDA